MNSTSRWLLADAGDSTAERDGCRNWVRLRHTLFAIAYAAVVMVSLSVVYSGTQVAIAWPAIGIAVWWASTCRSWRTFAFVCSFVFVVPALYLGLFQGGSLLAIVFVGFSHAIAGPAIGPVMALFERMHPTEVRNGDGRLFAPLARIQIPRHVYRLLIASLILIPIAKCFTLMAIVLVGDSVSIMLYLNLILRDLAGVIAIAGPGIALSSSAVRGIGVAAIREFVGVVVVTAVLLTLIFGPGQDLPVVYLAMLPLYWSATRLPVPVAAIHAVITACAATTLTYWAGAGPFAVSDDTPIAQASAIQLFIIMCVLLSLVVSTTVQQHSALVGELEALATTVPYALLVINRFGKAYPVNAAAHDLVVPTPDGMFVTRRSTIQTDPAVGH